MIKVKGQTLNVREESFIVNALMAGVEDDDAAFSVSREISEADTVEITSHKGVPEAARYLFSVGKFDYYAGDCDGCETALYIVKN